MQGITLAVPRRLASALADRYNGIVAVFRDLDAIAPWLLSRECLVGSIDFECVALIELPHPHV